MVTAIPLGPGDEAVVRMPTPAERRDHRLGKDEPVIEIRRGDGTSEVHGARQVKVSATDPPGSGTPGVEGDRERLER
jgi:hypothetical protein